jgi:branched-subunit amino acid aminotransferase/4-amino-4-deoxychorismate lyase
MRGFGVFDFLRTYNGKPFLLAQHLQRLRNSAKLLGLVVPLSDTEIEGIISELIRRSEMMEVNIRIILTGGQAVSGMLFDNDKLTFIVLIEEIHPLPTSVYSDGAKLITQEYKRPLFTAKHLDYMMTVSLQPKIKAAGAIEVLYIWEGQALEASTSNLFIIKNDVISTPKDDVLIGMTRNFILDIARPHYVIKESSITLEEVLSADEVFITATNKEIVPIVQIGDTVIDKGRVGVITQDLIADFKSRTI